MLAIRIRPLVRNGSARRSILVRPCSGCRRQLEPARLGASRGARIPAQLAAGRTHRRGARRSERGGGGRKLGAWNETRSRRRDPSSLPAPLLKQLDAMTAVDAALFAAALRLLLGRLRTVEAATGKPLLRCLDWAALWRSTRYVPGLWDGKDEGLLLPSEG